jgi:DNA-binding GntR family transcriptional regulator
MDSEIRNGKEGCGMSQMNGLQNIERIQQRATNLKVYDQIRDAIVAGRFRPGDTLSTRQFADALGVSQMPVREAFHRLVAEGALENRPNRTIGLPIISLQEFEEIVEIRILLESFAAGKSASNIDDQDCQQLSDLADAMELASTGINNQDYLRLNRVFHFTVYRGSGSVELVRMIEQVWLRIGPFLNWISNPSDSRSRSNCHHRAIIAACMNRDSDAATKAMMRDLEDGAEVVRIRLRMLAASRSA